MPCLESRQDSIMLYEGFSVQVYNTTTEQWSVLADKSAPIDMGLATCVLLPDDQILVVGYSSVHVYDILSDSREMKLTFPSTAYSNLIGLNGRVFTLRP